MKIHITNDVWLINLIKTKEKYNMDESNKKYIIEFLEKEIIQLKDSKERYVEQMSRYGKHLSDIMDKLDKAEDALNALKLDKELCHDNCCGKN